MNQDNQLLPVFFRTDKVKILIVGGGAVGTEKTEAILRHAPGARLTIVAPEIRKEIQDAAAIHPQQIELRYKPYEASDLNGHGLVIAATCLHELNKQVEQDADEARILCNVADTPELCDFYMASVVKKGNLKIAISTNGQSPTLAKRLREMMEDIIPEETDQVLANLQKIRETLKGDFEYKVQRLNEITTDLLKPNGPDEQQPS